MTATSHSVSLLMYHLTMFDQALRAALWSPWQQELLKNCKNWLSWWINIFHVNKHSPAIPCLISLFFFSTPDLKLKTNEFVYDGMLCFPLNPYHWHVVLFTVLPTPPRFGFCMHNFWISPIACSIASTCQWHHYDDVIMTMLESQITSLTVVYSIVYTGVHQRKHQSSASLAFVREIHPGPVNSPHKWPVTRKMFPFDDVIMQ